MHKTLVITGLIFILTGILLGAFGAHSLKEIISATKIASFETGVRYQLFQGLGLLIIGLHAKNEFSLTWYYRFMMVGTILFSCSIYLLAFSEIISLPIKIIGPFTPIGGSLMIISWATLLFQILKKSK